MERARCAVLLLPVCLAAARPAPSADEPRTCPASRPARLSLATDGRSGGCAIVHAADAAGPEKHAVQELATYLEKVTGADFEVVAGLRYGTAVIAVGPGVARMYDPAVDLSGLGPDGIVIRTSRRGPYLILTGGPGAPRGTLYAVYTFLADVVGCRWWAPQAEHVPRRPNLAIPSMDVRYVPPLEYRAPFYFHAFDGDWAVRNKYNGHHARLDDKRGGKISYHGFVHTFYSLVPPAKHFQAHPEWYSQIKGRRTHHRAQLCLTNPELRAFVIGRVKELLRGAPRAGIVSVSQNDWHGRCECPACRAVEAEEDSPAGPLLRFVNAVAEAVEKDHPAAAISTLAYQYTRKPPRRTRPRRNVIIRLCSIECSFAQPLEHDRNRAFRDDIAGWSKISRRLYVWDYVTNFAHYVQPHPNLRVLGPNVRFFVRHGVKGLFEQGNYQSFGGEFAELRAWVLARLCWDPTADDKQLIREFLSGYYGPAAPFIRRYIDLVHDQAERSGVYLNIGSPPDAPFLAPEVLWQAEELFQQAARAVRTTPAVLRRVEVARLPVRYVCIVRWPDIRSAAAKACRPWPLPATRGEAISQFERVCRENKVTLLSEWGGRRIDWLRKRFLPATMPGKP